MRRRTHPHHRRRSALNWKVCRDDLQSVRFCRSGCTKRRGRRDSAAQRLRNGRHQETEHAVQTEIFFRVVPWRIAADGRSGFPWRCSPGLDMRYALRGVRSYNEATAAFVQFFLAAIGCLQWKSVNSRMLSIQFHFRNNN